MESTRVEWHGMEWNGMEGNGMEWNHSELSQSSTLMPLHSATGYQSV